MFAAANQAPLHPRYSRPQATNFKVPVPSKASSTSAALSLSAGTGVQAKRPDLKYRQPALQQPALLQLRKELAKGNNNGPLIHRVRPGRNAGKRP